MTAKPSGASVVLRNGQGAYLLVRHVYKEGWFFPGGGIEKYEAPSIAAAREIREELGITIKASSLLCLDYQCNGSIESLQFIFDGGRISEDDIKTIALQAEEIAEAKFFELSDVLRLLTGAAARRFPRVAESLDNGAIAYLELQMPLIARDECG